MLDKWANISPPSH